MQLSKPLAIVLSTIATLGSFACGDIAAEPIRAQGPAALSSVGTHSEDPYACELVPTGASSGYSYRDVYTPICKLTGAPCLADGSGSRTVDPVTGQITNQSDLRMVCEHLCQVDSDCPAPETGTAVATCLWLAEPSPENQYGECVLSCDAGETCPQGFECRDSRGGSAYATWPQSCVGAPVSIHWTGAPR
jgi:hypothetical protein